MLVDIGVIKTTKENLLAAKTNFSIKVMSLQTCSMIYYPFTIRNSNNLELKLFEGKYFWEESWKKEFIKWVTMTFADKEYSV